MAVPTQNITKFVEEPVWVLVGDPSQTKDASPNILAEKLFACIEIVQRSRTVGTHHKFIPKPGGMLANTLVSLQIVIHRSSKMSLEQDLKQPASSSILADLDNFSRRNIFFLQSVFHNRSRIIETHRKLTSKLKFTAAYPRNAPKS